MEPLHGYLYETLIGLPWDATRFEGFQALQAKLQQHYQYGGPSCALAYMDGLLKTGMAAEKAMIGSVNGGTNGSQLGSQLFGTSPSFTQAATQAVQGGIGEQQVASLSTSSANLHGLAVPPSQQMQQQRLGAPSTGHQHGNISSSLGQAATPGVLSLLGNGSQEQQQQQAMSTMSSQHGSLESLPQANHAENGVHSGLLQSGSQEHGAFSARQAAPLSAALLQLQAPQQSNACMSKAEVGKSSWSAIVRQSAGGAGYATGSGSAASAAGNHGVAGSADDDEYQENVAGHANGVVRSDSRSQTSSAAAAINGNSLFSIALGGSDGACVEDQQSGPDGPYLALAAGGPVEAILESVAECSWYCVGCGISNTLSTLKRAACQSCERSLCMLGVRLQCDGTFADHPCRMMHLAIPQSNVATLLDEELPQGKAGEIASALARFVEQHASNSQSDASVGSATKPSPRGKVGRVAVPIPTSPAPKPKAAPSAALVNVAEATWMCEPCGRTNTITSIKTAKCTSCGKDLCFSYIKGHCNGTHNGRPCKLLHLVVGDNVRGMPTHRSNAKHDIPDMLRCFVQRIRLEQKQ